MHSAMSRLGFSQYIKYTLVQSFTIQKSHRWLDFFIILYRYFLTSLKGCSEILSCRIIIVVNISLIISLIYVRFVHTNFT